MTNNLLQIKIKQRLNKLASFYYDNIECWQIAEAANKAQLSLCREQVYGYNLRKEGVDQSTGLIDDLRILFVDKDISTTISKNNLYFEGIIPKDYLYYIRIDAEAKTDCCPNRRLSVYQVEESNIGVILSSNNKAPSFQWAETIATLSGETLRVYSDNQFEITNTNLVYIRQPKEIQFIGCVNPNTGVVYIANQDCEFKDDIAEIIVDKAAGILAGDLEIITQYQRAQQETQKTT